MELWVGTSTINYEWFYPWPCSIAGWYIPMIFRGSLHIWSSLPAWNQAGLWKARIWVPSGSNLTLYKVQLYPQHSLRRYWVISKKLSWLMYILGITVASNSHTNHCKIQWHCSFVDGLSSPRCSNPFCILLITSSFCPIYFVHSLYPPLYPLL